MKLPIPRLLLIAALLSSGCDEQVSKQSGEQPTQPKAAGLANPIDNPEQPDEEAQGPYTAAGAWSEPVNGLSARLLVTYEEMKSNKYPTYFHYQKVILEAKNVGTETVSFINQPSFTDLAIRNAQGEELHGRGHEGNHITGASEWAVIPVGAYLGLRVDTTIPVHVGLYFESFATETHSLHATLVVEKQDGPQNQWIGKIKLHPIYLVPSGRTL